MKKLVACATVLVLALAGPGHSLAQEHAEGDKDHKAHEDHKDDHEAAEVHGGVVVASPHHHFEVVFTDTAVRLYVLDLKQKTLETDKITGALKLIRKAGEKPTEQPLKHVEADAKKATARDYLEADFDSKTTTKGTKVHFELAGLPDEHETKASFEVEFEGISPKVEYVCPKGCGAKMVDPGPCPKCKVELRKVGGDHHDDHKK